ncbi:hypothetical protein FACS1894196_2290 [Clostridia bacterium]|nr:hypothetical protein FACS1894196_2290 [Clostridia bacterium]
MELGRRIKALRAQRGMTQEALAEILGVTPQAVSKWEREVSAPDIAMLPTLSVVFGVTIDELFSLTDEENLKRIDNMLGDVRDLSPTVFASTEVLLEGIVARKPGCGDAYLRLAELYDHRIQTLGRLAVDYARQAIRIMPDKKACHSVLANVLHGYGRDWASENTLEMVRYYRALMQMVPEWQEGWAWLLDQLIGNGLLDEARAVIASMEKAGHHALSKARLGDIAYAEGKGEEALGLWQACIDDAPDAWRPWAYRADQMVRMGRYREAIADYEAWIEKQPAPRFIDPYGCIALLYEELGDVARAIQAREEQLRVCREEHGLESGETVDGIGREIARLRMV